jgi:hypothetical protein
LKSTTDKPLPIKDLFQIESERTGKSIFEIKKQVAKTLGASDVDGISSRMIDYGIQNSILGGPGQLFPSDHRRILRKLDAIDPNALSSVVKNVMDPKREQKIESAAGASELADITREALLEMKGKAFSELFPPDVTSRAPDLPRPCDSTTTEEETLFVIDVNIDGVQIWKNSPMAQVIPILGCIYSIGNYVIPLDQCKPFLIGISHGNYKGSIFAFLDAFCKEIEDLDPTKEKGYAGRKIAVYIRSFICDSPMRSWIFGLIGHSGYYPCSRCHIRGENPPPQPVKEGEKPKRERGIYFVRCDCEKRIDELWHEYTEMEPGETEKTKKHRKFATPLDSTYIRHRSISSVIVEPMHTSDGHVAAECIKWSLGLSEDQPQMTKLMTTVSH